MLISATRSQYVGIAVGILAAAAAYVFFSWYSYRYFTMYFNMPKWLRVALSLGGFLTYIFYVMPDEFTHTSMMGENTRTWKNDPEKGVHILSHKEIWKLQKEGRLEIIQHPDETSPSDDD
jgi:hypothetical protein